METKDTRNVRDVFNDNIFIDDTRGEVHINEIIELVNDMFEDVMQKGPIAGEPCFGVLVRLVDVKLHEDAIHRGPAQMYPAVRDGIRDAFKMASPMLFEPVQTLRFRGAARVHGRDLETHHEQARHCSICSSTRVRSPCREDPGWRDVRDVGRATWRDRRPRSSFVVDQAFEKLPHEHQGRVTSQIRERKGLKSE